MLLAIGISGPQLLVVFVVILLLFGRRLPDLMRSLGKSIPEFKKGLNDNDGDPPADSSAR